jgi:hypothetical protein
MAFKSLSAVINARVQQVARETASGVRYINAANINASYGRNVGQMPIEEENVLVWGRSTWGVEKVTSFYKP